MLVAARTLENIFRCNIGYRLTISLLLFLTPLNIRTPTDAPIVTLSLGSNLDPKNLAKGTDVYLECRIEANPAIKKIEWFHNNQPLQQARGVIITNQSLVLQSISKKTHGQYMCRAGNIQGSVSSNDLYLDIKCEFKSETEKATQWWWGEHVNSKLNSIDLEASARSSATHIKALLYWVLFLPFINKNEFQFTDPPSCQYEGGRVIRAALKQTINITCDIDSNPMVSFICFV